MARTGEVCVTHESLTSLCAQDYVDGRMHRLERQRCSDLGGPDWQPPPPPGVEVISRTERHGVQQRCAGVHCAWHNVDEPGEHYLVCGECWHGFRTPAALLLAHNLLMVQIDPTRTRVRLETHPRDVFACPLCTHDL